MIQRLFALIGTLWLTATITFVALRLLPGNAITNQMFDSGASQSQITNRQAALGLDQPLHRQYLDWLNDLTQGNLGVSIADGRPVSEVIAQQLTPTLQLAASAGLIAIIGGIAVGCWAGFGHRLPKLILSGALSTPIYWTGTLIIWVTAANARWLSASSDGISLFLASSVLGFHTSGGIGRLIATTVNETRNADFITTAYSKGLYQQVIVRRHILRASLLPSINLIALQIGFLMSGTIITETVFNRPGIGRILLDAVMRQDYPVVQGIAIWAAFAYTLVTVAADIIYRLIDPRVAA